MTLTEFLLACIAEDEVEARFEALGELVPSDCWGPDRIRAECEAKRRIVERLDRVISDANAGYEGPDYYGGIEACEDVLYLLALPYADHPDYRQEWRP